MSKRRLAAIMFSDIVGYDSLLKEDEKKAFEYLRKNQRIHKRLIKKFNGRWLKDMESATLASFTSNIDAVMCAVSLQKATEELGIPLRIGLHQGDVVFEKNDVLGDGVNIASRILGFAKTNGIVISETVHNNIKNKEGLEIDPLGTQQLKGVENPLRIFCVSCHDINILDIKIDTGELIRPLGFGRSTIVAGILLIALLAYASYYFLPEIINPKLKLGNSIVVLPFDNYTGSDTLEYFVAGMHSSLIGDIGKISSLQVKSKTTSNAYKDVEKSISEIASELGVNVIIEGSVMCLGDSVCLQVKLVSTYPEEQTLWVQDYKEEKSEILSLYNKVTKEISEEINVILTPQEESMLAEYRTVNNEAYDAYLKGLLYWDRLGREDLEKAIEYFNTAVGKDPSWAPPYAGLASSWGGLMQMGFVQPTVAISKIYDNLNKALELDPKSANSHYVKATMAVWLEWNWEKGEEEFLKTIELNPNDALSHAYYAHLLSLLRRPEESLNQAQLALELDPLRPLVMALYATVMINTGNYQDAVDQTKKALSIDPNHFFANVMMEYASYYIGDYKRSIQALKHIYQLDNDNAFEIDNAMDEQGYIPALKILIHILEERGKAGFYLPFDLATYNLRINEYEKALDWIEKGYEVHDPNMPYITTKIAFYDQLKGNPRFIELLKKMNLPVD